MKEARIDILSPEILKTADAICFTSNGIVKSNGELVMGAGVAKAFADKYPGASFYFGQWVSKVGNKLFAMDNKPMVVSFPTKHHWRDPSSIDLIKKSTTELVGLTNHTGWKNVYLPRPGVGLGGLDWKVVKTVIEPLLDDRFTVVYK